MRSRPRCSTLGPMNYDLRLFCHTLENAKHIARTCGAFTCIFISTYGVVGSYGREMSFEVGVSVVSSKTG